MPTAEAKKYAPNHHKIHRLRIVWINAGHHILSCSGEVWYKMCNLESSAARVQKIPGYKYPEPGVFNCL